MVIVVKEEFTWNSPSATVKIKIAIIPGGEIRETVTIIPGEDVLEFRGNELSNFLKRLEGLQEDALRGVGAIKGLLHYPCPTEEKR